MYAYKTGRSLSTRALSSGLIAAQSASAACCPGVFLARVMSSFASDRSMSTTVPCDTPAARASCRVVIPRASRMALSQ